MSSGAISGRVSDLLPDGVRPHQLRTKLGTDLSTRLSQGDLAGVLGIQVESVGAYLRPRDQARAKKATADSVPTSVTHRLLSVVGPIDLNPTGAEAQKSSSECWLPEDLDQLIEAA